MERLSFFRAIRYTHSDANYFERGIDKIESYFDLSPLKARVSVKNLEPGVHGVEYFRSSSSCLSVILKVSAQACMIFPFLALLTPPLLSSLPIISTIVCTVGSVSLALLAIKILFRSTHHFRFLTPEEFVLKCLDEKSIKKAITFVQEMPTGLQRDQSALLLAEKLMETADLEKVFDAVDCIDDMKTRDSFLMRSIEDLKNKNTEPHILFQFIRKISDPQKKDPLLVWLCQEFYQKDMEKTFLIANRITTKRIQKNFLYKFFDAHKNEPEKLLAQLENLGDLSYYKRLAEICLNDSNLNLSVAEHAIKKGREFTYELRLPLAKKYLESNAPEEAYRIALQYRLTDEKLLIKIANFFFEKKDIKKTLEIILKTKEKFKEKDNLIISLIDEWIRLKHTDYSDYQTIYQKISDDNQRETAIKKILELFYQEKKFRICFWLIENLTNENFIQDKTREIFRSICEENKVKDAFYLIRNVHCSNFLKKEILSTLKEKALEKEDLKIAMKIFKEIINLEYEGSEIEEQEAIEHRLKNEGQFILDKAKAYFAENRLEDSLKMLLFAFDEDAQTEFLAEIYQRNPEENLGLMQNVFGKKRTYSKLARYFYQQQEHVAAFRMLEQALPEDSFKRALCANIRNRLSNPQEASTKASKDASRLIHFFYKGGKENYSDEDKRDNRLDLLGQYLNQETLEIFWDLLQTSAESSKGVYDTCFEKQSNRFLDQGFPRNALIPAGKIQDRTKKDALLSTILVASIPDPDLASEVVEKISKSFFFSHIKEISKNCFVKHGYEKCSQARLKIENDSKSLAFVKEIMDLFCEES